LAACLGAGLIVVGLIGWLAHAPTYSTDIGEQHSIVLRDGSTVNLNSRSRIRIRYSGRERAVDLLEGQALFTVAKDATRPFIVIAGSTQVRAVGTEFDVYCKATGTVVTVVEGRVAVLARPMDSGDSAGRSAPLQTPALRDKATEKAGSDVPGVRFLSAGEQLMVTPQAAARPVAANVAAATAWTQRQLIFDSTPLNEVADEFNRYNERQFVIRDPGLDTFQIDGVFSSTDPTSLIRFLRARPDMKVTETDSEIIIAHR
jgi:transmembrane sensor